MKTLPFVCFSALLGFVHDSVGQDSAHVKRAITPPLVNLQVYPPILVGSSGGVSLTNGSGSGVITGTPSGCVVQQTLAVHSFGNSYGVPYVGEIEIESRRNLRVNGCVGSYTPPTNCSFNRVVFNLTVTVAGVQFDRLGEMYLGDTEIWRTSTAEPTLNGIV